MDDVLGVILLAGYILGVVGLAAGITYVVVKVFPTKDDGDKPADGKKQAPANDSSAGGRLFRRARRGLT